jgi:RNA polymerase sigma-70 factor (ECF subfamily)
MEASRSLHRSALGDAAFDRLVRTHRAPLERSVRSLGASREDAEEIAATALLRAYLRPPGIRLEREWRAWLMAVARNLWIDAKRRRELRLVTGDGVLEAVPSASRPVDQIADAALEARQICTAIALLPSNQRAVIYLREVRGLSYEEIASELGMTVSVVTATLHRARDNVKQRRSGIANALSALGLAPLAWLRRGAHAARVAGAPAAAKFAVPVMLVASAGGAGVLAVQGHARAPVPAAAVAANLPHAPRVPLRATLSTQTGNSFTARKRIPIAGPAPARLTPGSQQAPTAALSPRRTVATADAAVTPASDARATPSAAHGGANADGANAAARVPPSAAHGGANADGANASAHRIARRGPANVRAGAHAAAAPGSAATATAQSRRAAAAAKAATARASATTAGTSVSAHQSAAAPPGSVSPEQAAQGSAAGASANAVGAPAAGTGAESANGSPPASGNGAESANGSAPTAPSTPGTPGAPPQGKPQQP